MRLAQSSSEVEVDFNIGGAPPPAAERATISVTPMAEGRKNVKKAAVRLEIIVSESL